MDARIANLLEYKAEALLARFDPILLEAAQATPLGRLGKWLGSEYGVRFGGREALGSDDSGRVGQNDDLAVKTLDRRAP